MEDRRKPAHLVSPEGEDDGIYRSGIVRLTVRLVPVFGRNTRGDLMIKGYVGPESAIDVVFPGRRRRDASDLEQRLKAEWQRIAQAARSRGRTPDIETARLPVMVEGAWRPRFRRDDQGWQTRDHQFYAARWAFVDQAGQSVTFGEAVRHGAPATGGAGQRPQTSPPR